MDRADSVLALRLARRRLLAVAALGSAGAAMATTDRGISALTPSPTPLSNAFPQKRGMIVQRNRPPLLETPLSAFDGQVFTPNDRFFVRWHWSNIPLEVDVESFRLTVSGKAARPLSLSLKDILAMPRMSIAAVNQCSGNSRALFNPRVPGAQWAHGAMGNALWEGVSLRTILDRAGVQGDAVAVRFGGLDLPLTDVDPFEKSLAIDHARDGEVMLAFAMNGEQLPMLNGFPLRLVVPGWYSTYWVKALNSIEVLSAEDQKYWMAKAYRIPKTPNANVAPDAKGFATEPINRMIPRSWITSIEPGSEAAYQPDLPVRGIAMGGTSGVRRVEISSNGRDWTDAKLGSDEGSYGFRLFSGTLPVPGRGALMLMSRCTNAAGVTQAMEPNWNAGGYMRGCVEQVPVRIS
ncbi:molybdopterin-dependent oxidoreductase [Sphingobium sp. B8D3D]|uniref:molybdopterin-dependent oxidoreductase n=1 Tax=unclassified Sphingobium TaxID=2611147 RepID=UPI0022256217|nr:molybdopterin-dependent oxidoreductase [Sphingobium sp. B8D3D]